VRIAVTGGSGFIGKAVLTWAETNGHEVWTFDRADGHDILGDLDGLKGADSVIHLAGLLGTHELFEEAEEAVRINVVGSLRVMQWCIENGSGYVGIMMPDLFPSIYTATKIASKRLADALHHSRGLKVSHVRAFNAYGRGQKFGPGHPQKILPTFAVAGWRNEPIPIWGDGCQVVDLIHADDLAKLLVFATGWTGNQVFDGGTGTQISINALASFVLKVTGSTGGVVHLPMRDGEIPPKNCRATGEGWDLLPPGLEPTFDWGRIANAIVSYKR
jgi:UDP-glucose 4-epimerase